MQGNGHLFIRHDPVELKTLASDFFNCAEYQHRANSITFCKMENLKGSPLFPYMRRFHKKEIFFFKSKKLHGQHNYDLLHECSRPSRD